MLSVIFITLDYKQNYGTFPDFVISYKNEIVQLDVPSFFNWEFGNDSNF